MPVVDDAVGGDQGAAAQLVAPVEDGLQSVGALGGKLAGQEEIVEDGEIGVDEGLQALALVAAVRPMRLARSNR